MGLRFDSLHQAQLVSSPSRGFAPQDKVLVHALPLSTRLSVFPPRVAGSHCRTRLGSRFCLSAPGSACLLADYRARIAQQVLGPCFASLHQAQRVFSLSRGLASRNKALVHALPLSNRLSVTPRRVAVLHRRTRFWSKLCLSPPGSALLLAKSRARIIGQGLSPRFATLHQAQRFSSTSRGLAPWDKVLVYALPLSTMLSGSPRRFACSHRRTKLGSTLSLSLPSLSVFPRRVAGSHCRKRLGSTVCLSPPGSACLLANSRASTKKQGLGP